MLSTKALLGLYLANACLLTSGSITLGNAFAQESVNNQLQGYYGTVTVLPNTELKEITIVLNLNYAPSGSSNQIVFHIQAEAASSVPSAWSGPARVLVGYGVVAVIPQNQSNGILFKFTGLQRPPSIAEMNFDDYSVFGIGRFGEHTPLTPTQIQQLASAGRITDVSQRYDPSTAKMVSDGLFGSSLNPADLPPPNSCVAGGVGSTSCSAGGCGVNCSATTYSCCAGGTCLCFPNNSNH